MRKRRIVGMAVIIGIILGVTVFAAQQISEIAKSTITSSNVKIGLLMTEIKDGSESEVSEETVITPGADISRIAKVKNTGDQPAWVRVKADIVINGDSISAANNEYLTLSGGDTTNWEWKDGYWYYAKPLAPGETSAELFKEVKISDRIKPENFDGANLKVDAEGTQVKNNGSTVFEAQGWPSN